MSEAASRRALLAVCVAGVAVAGYLTWAHFEPGSLICTGNGGCEQVQESEYAVVAGIPVAVLGLAAWLAALGLTVFDTPLTRTILAALAVTALAFAAYLVVLQLFVIDAICAWCIVNDVVLVPTLAALSLLRLRVAPAG